MSKTKFRIWFTLYTATVISGGLLTGAVIANIAINHLITS